MFERIYPTDGPLVGGTFVTILAATNIGDGSDVTLVSLGGHQTEIVEQSEKLLIVKTAEASPSFDRIPLTLIVESTSFGKSIMTEAFTYYARMFLRIICLLIPPAAVFTVTPSDGPSAGGTAVTLTSDSETPFGGDTRLIEVLICNQPAVIVHDSQHEIIVVTSPEQTASVEPCDVTVRSERYGETNKLAAFTYNIRMFHL